jgi:hypothetical protein
MSGRVVRLATELVARYRAVDREPIGSAVVDTPGHLDELTESIRVEGIRVPLRLGFNTRVGFLDGNHRIAAALRLGLAEVPVELFRAPARLRPSHARPMRRDDLAVIAAAFLAALSERGLETGGGGRQGPKRGPTGA